MGSDVSKSHFRGILVPDPRLTTVWSAQSSFSQADPQPGVPEAQGSYQLVLTSSGSQAASKTLNLQSTGQGFVAPGSNSSFAWKESTDGSTQYRGYNVPNAISRFDAITWGTSVYSVNPHAVVLDDQTCILAYQNFATVVVSVRSSSGSSFGSPVTVYSQTSSPSAGLNARFNPRLLVMPDSTIMLYFFSENSAGTLGQVVAYRSADKGASWSLVSSGVLPDPIDISGTDGWALEDLCAAQGDGQVSLIISVDSLGSASGSYIQYASDSGGVTFTLIEGPELVGSGDGYGGSIDLVYAGGSFIVFSATGASGTAIYARFIRIGSAYTRLDLGTVTAKKYSAATGTNVFFGAISGGVDNPAMVVADDGTVYAYFAFGEQNISASTYKHVGAVVRSVDFGVTIEDFGQMGLSGLPDGIWCYLGGNQTGIHTQNITTPCAVMCNGQVEIFCNTYAYSSGATLGDYADSLISLKLGGPSTVSFNPVSGYGPQLSSRGSFSETYIPVKSPAVTGDHYSRTATGTGAEAITSDAELRLSSSSTGKIYYTLNTPASDLAEGYILNFALSVASPAVSSNQSVAISMRLANGAAGDFRVSLRFKTGAVVVKDEVASTTVATITLDMTTEREFLVSFLGGAASTNNGKIRVWHRVSSSDNDKNWVLGATYSILQCKTSSPAAANELIWGANLDGASIVTQSDWKFFNVMRSTQCGGNIAAQTNPTDLYGRPYAGRGFRSYVDGGVYVTAHDGPSVGGDQYNISTRYGYPIDNVFTSQSATPRTVWRSTDLTEQTIALALDQTLLENQESLPGSDVIGICLLNINFKTAVLQGFDQGSASWTTIANIDTSSGLSSLQFDKQGNVVRPGTGSASQVFLQMNELEGSTFALDDSSDVQYRKIVANTSGKWDRTTTTKYPQIILEGVTTSDNTSGNAGYIIPKDVTIIAKMNGTLYSGYRLKIPAQTTCRDSYFQVGNVILGWVEAFGNQYSWGRIIETTANTAVSSRADGVTTSRNFGPAVRQVQFAWTDGVDVSSTQGSTPDPNYIKGSADGSAEALAAVGATPYVMEGLVRLLNGPDKPVVYLPSVVKSGNTVVLNRRDSFVAGRVSSPARLESVVGNELADPGEVFRIASVVIDEMV